jgi:shikimate kinase
MRLIIIGPVSIGKTTIANEIGKRLQLPVAHLDDYRLSYYEEIGYSAEHCEIIKENIGWGGVYKYWQIFDVYAVTKFIQQFNNHILDFGGGNSVFEFDEDLDIISNLLDNELNVFLLLPTDNYEDNLEFLNKRTGWKNTGRNVNKHLLSNKSNYVLAKHIIYVKDKATQDICDEIIEQVSF